MRVFVFSGSRRGGPVYGKLGERRWECEWYELTAAATKRYNDDSHYEVDYDRDVVCCSSVHQTKAEAITEGQTKAPESVYGCAIVQAHVLDWMVEEDRVGDWEPVGPRFEVDGLGDVSEV